MSEQYPNQQPSLGGAAARSNPARDRQTVKEDTVDTFYREMQAATGRPSSGGPIGLVVAGTFILAVGLLLLAILTGANLHQLAIVGAVVVVVNLVVTLVLTAPSLKSG